MFLNLKCIFAPFAFGLFYYLQSYLEYKTLLFTIHSMVFNHILRGDNYPPGISANNYEHFLCLFVPYYESRVVLLIC